MSAVFVILKWQVRLAATGRWAFEASTVYNLKCLFKDKCLLVRYKIKMRFSAP